MTRSGVVSVKTLASALVVGAFLIVGAPAFATVVVGDLTPASPPQYINFGGSALAAQPFTLASSSTVDQVDVAWWTTHLHPTTLSETVTIYIADGLAAGSHNLVTLHEPVSVPSGINESTHSYQFSPVTLPAGTYYLILGASVGAVFSWSQNSPGSTEVGTIGRPRFNSGPEFGPGWHTDPCEMAGPMDVCVTNNTMSFDLELVKRLVPATPVGVGLGQIIHLTVYAGPVTVPPGVPVEATVGFVDGDGRGLGQSTQISLGAGQTTSVDLSADAFINQGARRIEVLPVISEITTADPEIPSLGASVEVIDANTGFATVLATARTTTSLPAALEFAPQGLADGQTARLNVAAAPSGACAATLSFVDGNGAPVGQGLPVNLASGTVASLSVTARSLGLGRGQRTELRPMLSTATNCLGSAEVFDDLTGRTSTYQSARGQ
jgi:hypothetical protein